MEDLYDTAADHFLELASPQRLKILFSLLYKKSTITSLAKDLNSTKQEVHRNFRRLEDRDLIEKDIDGNYHDFGGVPSKFIMRSGQLATGKHIKGVVKILEQWKQIYKNANEYIYEVLYEVPLDLIEPLVKRIKQGIKFNYVFSKSAITPKGRKELLKKLGFDKLIEKGLVERKMDEKVFTVIVLNEKEACVLFPNKQGEPDMSEMFYGNDPMFHEWCLDYFRYCWYGSDMFQESKLTE